MSPPARGRLELGPHALRFVGTDASASDVVDEIRYDDLAGVRVGREPADRLDGHRTVVVDAVDGDLVTIAGVAEPGAIGELADRLATLQRSNSRWHAAIVAPLQPGSADAVRQLLRKGPPFDPEHLGCDRHYVYVTDEEVVFVFDWRDRGSLEALLGEADLWERAVEWHPHLSGAPRVAELAYIWSGSRGIDTSFLPPGLHAQPR